MIGVNGEYMKAYGEDENMINDRVKWRETIRVVDLTYVE